MQCPLIAPSRTLPSRDQTLCYTVRAMSTGLCLAWKVRGKNLEIDDNFELVSTSGFLLKNEAGFVPQLGLYYS